MFKMAVKQISSLEKVFLSRNGMMNEISKASVLRNERYSYQIAYIAEGDMRFDADVKVKAPNGVKVELRKVGNVPGERVTNHDNADGHFLRDEPGLFPDPLYPMEGDIIQVDPFLMHALWVTVSFDENVKAGNYCVEIEFINSEHSVSEKCVMELELIDAYLPKADIVHTEWFHSDCIATYYNVEVFSESHWELIEKFIEKAAYIGINMILTPVFTPPLDTEIGGERPTVQLVKVKKDGNKYSFDFTLFEKWVGICKKHGIKYYEISHLFTQWGAFHAPKIIAEVNGEEKKIFGWETDASGDEYAGFLRQFIPELVEKLKEEGIAENTYFHVSDEPTKDHEESYKKAADIIKPMLKGFKIIDALSDYLFYEKGLVEHPIPSNDHIKAFLKNNVPDLWTYYCCCQTNKVSNRMMAMPSYRNRIMGTQLYRYDIKGFLQWGYNFYYTQCSKKAINPFLVTDAGGAFVSGDAFMVYPYNDGPIESIRSVVFYEGLQDLAAMQLLEKYIGKEKVKELIDSEAGYMIEFDRYPHSPRYILDMREKINALIKENAR